MPLLSLHEKALLRPIGRPGRGSSPVWAETSGSGRHCRLELPASGGAPKTFKPGTRRETDPPLVALHRL